MRERGTEEGQRGSAVAYAAVPEEPREERPGTNTGAGQGVGDGPRRLTVGDSGDGAAAPDVGAPDWSSWGDELVYSCCAARSFDVWVVGADGTGNRRLTDDPAHDWQQTSVAKGWIR